MNMNNNNNMNYNKNHNFGNNMNMSKNNYMKNINNSNINENIMINKNNNIYNNNSFDNIITVFFSYNSNPTIPIKVNIKEKISNLIEKYKKESKNNDQNLKFYYYDIALNPDLSVEEAGIYDKSTIIVKKGLINKFNIQNECLDDDSEIEKVINIKFIKQPNIKYYAKYSDVELYGLLKLCLLKEISPKLSDNQLLYLKPEILSYIMKILRNGYIDVPDMKECIKEVLLKMCGSNIVSFSKYVNEIIKSNELSLIMKYLDEMQLNEINDIKNRLSKYNEYILNFEREFEIAKRNSVFEFSIISLVIIEREDFERFENERKNCPNRVDKILYHGTNIEPISCILTEYFKKSIVSGYQHGKGVYFTDLLDYCWFYGGIKNRINKNKIPQINETFTLIACSTYYNQNGYRQVYNEKYTPKKNEINFAYADCEKLETLINPDKSKFYGTEYVIWDLDQICPFISAKLERQEYCVIWRDPNFSSKPVYNDKFDNIFKEFLKERIKYIEQVAKYNIYPCETTEEALNLIRRKKYNKIILISNVGNDLGGKKFVSEARKIIGNDVIALFLAYSISHLNWIINYPNAIFSNEPKFYENYLECFNDIDTNKVKENIQILIRSIENHYNVRFNKNFRFNINYNTYLDFPYFKGSGFYSDLTF